MKSSEIIERVMNGEDVDGLIHSFLQEAVMPGSRLSKFVVDKIGKHLGYELAGGTIRGERKPADINVAQREYDRMVSVRPELKDVDVHVGGTNTLHDIRKMWKRKDISLGKKVLGTASLPVANLGVNMAKIDHYNPLTHSVVIHHVAEPGRFSPGSHILHHELGHALDIKGDYGELSRRKKGQVGSAPNPVTDKFINANFGKESKIGSTAYNELRANQASMSALRDLNKKNPDPNFQEFRKDRKEVLKAPLETYLDHQKTVVKNRKEREEKGIHPATHVAKTALGMSAVSGLSLGMYGSVIGGAKGIIDHVRRKKDASVLKGAWRGAKIGAKIGAPLGAVAGVIQGIGDL